MEMKGEYRIPASRLVVWEALNDPEVLKAAIAGCEELERDSDTGFTAKVKAKVGPVSARFSGIVKIVNPDPPKVRDISRAVSAALEVPLDSLKAALTWFWWKMARTRF